jgi:upstream activation factor subunit UAF30
MATKKTVDRAAVKNPITKAALLDELKKRGWQHKAGYDWVRKVGRSIKHGVEVRITKVKVGRELIPIDHISRTDRQRLDALFGPVLTKQELAEQKPRAAKATVPRRPQPAFMAPMQPDAVLGAVVGDIAVPRTEITKKLWDYIKQHGLQDAVNRRQINADDRLKAVFGKSTVNMFEMNELIGKHLTKVGV